MLFRTNERKFRYFFARILNWIQWIVTGDFSVDINFISFLDFVLKNLEARHKIICSSEQRVLYNIKWTIRIYRRTVIA
jgi:hypothetical protein